MRGPAFYLRLQVLLTAGAVARTHMMRTELQAGHMSIIFKANDTLKTCYRNPALIRTRSGALLCFVEERYRGSDWEPNNIGDHSCPDNYEGNPGGHNLGFSRSDDGGISWSPIVRLAGNLSNLAQSGGVDFTNNLVIAASLPNGTERLLWLYSTQNNPSAHEHGRMLQRHSNDDGKTWSEPPVDLSEVSARVGLPGATPGPGIGMQHTDGRIIVCVWSNRSPLPHGNHGWGNASNFGNFLMVSEDFGSSWKAAGVGAILDQGLNECSVAQDYASDKIIVISRRTNPDASVPANLMYPSHTFARVVYSLDLQERSPVQTLVGNSVVLKAVDKTYLRSVMSFQSASMMPTPICKGSLLERNNSLLFAHPFSLETRENLTIQKSVDGGITWKSSTLVCGIECGGSGYSSMTNLLNKIGIAYNWWPTNQTNSSKDGPGQAVMFSVISIL